MGACAVCGEGPVVRGICRACHAREGAEPGPSPAGSEEDGLTARRAAWYAAAGEEAPEAVTTAGLVEREAREAASPRKRERNAADERDPDDEPAVAEEKAQQRGNTTVALLYLAAAGGALVTGIVSGELGPGAFSLLWNLGIAVALLIGASWVRAAVIFGTVAEFLGVLIVAGMVGLLMTAGGHPLAPFVSGAVVVLGVIAPAAKLTCFFAPGRELRKAAAGVALACIGLGTVANLVATFLEPDKVAAAITGLSATAAGGRFASERLGFAVTIPSDLVQLEPGKAPAEGRKFAGFPEGAEGVYVASADGSFVGAVYASPVTFRPGDNPTSLLSNGVRAELRPVPNVAKLPAKLSAFQAWSFDLAGGGTIGTAHVAVKDSGVALRVVGWGPAVFAARTEGRVTALVAGLEP